MKDVVGFINYKISINGDVYNKVTGYKLKPFLDKDGYEKYSMCGKQRFKHRLIAIHFIDNANNYPVVNHKDGNKSNNSIDNLEWCTHKQNSRHAWDSGLCVVTEKMKITTRKNNVKYKGRLVLNTITGIYYDSIRDAVTTLPYGHSTLIEKIKNKNTPFIYA